LEFQFYLFISIFFYFFKKNLKLILIIFFLSILFAQIGGNLKYNYPFIENEFFFFNPIFGSFYMLPTRLFEFCFGIFLAIYKREFFIFEKKKINDSLDYLSLIGLISFFIFGTKELPHPSIVTLIICFFAANLIIDNNSNNLVRIILKNKNLSKFGLISYGFYLWHYVIIYFFNLEKITELNFLNSTLIFLVTFILSYISYNVIEKPLRLKTKKIFKFLTYSFAIIFLIIINNKNFIEIKQTKRLDSNILKEYEDFNNYEKKYSNCRGKSIINSCIYGDKENLNTFVGPKHHCGSACIYILSSGIIRMAYGEVTVHRTTYEDGYPTEKLEKSLKQTDVDNANHLFEMGMSTQLVDAIRITPNYTNFKLDYK
jgi:hypothetical protein